MREIAKDVYLSFSTIDKIIRESQCQVEPKPDKSTSSRAFFLFENKMNLIQVTIELDLVPIDAENIHQSYLRLKGLDKIVTYCQTVEKYLASFSDFVYACAVHTPVSQKILDITNLIKLNLGLKDKRLRLMSLYSSELNRINVLKRAEEAAKQRIENLKQEEYNRWYSLFGNGKYNSINQSDEK